MGKFFDTFPRIAYDIQGKRLTNYQSTTNILFRLRIIRSVLSNLSAYYEHLVADGDTPEILAEKVYSDPEAHWIIMMANDIVDAQYDWPLNYDQFNKYIISKYGSIENAQTTYHHYEKVVRREESRSGTVSEFRYIVNASNVASQMADTTIPYDHYGNLANEQDVSATSVSIGTGTVIEIIYRDRITNYDYEQQQNEKKRSIKIIKPEYYNQIKKELDDQTQFSKNISFIRGFR